MKDHSTGLALLQLPAGFQYKSFSWTGDAMENGQPVPGSHDGMAVVSSRLRGGAHELVLVRNHERGNGDVIDAPGKYDTLSFPSTLGGGTTNLVFRQGVAQWVKTEPSLGGTIVNCAGGATPWGTWLTCEETIEDLSPLGGRKHGYVFEVGGDPSTTTGEPIVGMGRFSHEAVALDPASGIVYLTHDDRNKSGFYRYIPSDGSNDRARCHKEVASRPRRSRASRTRACSRRAWATSTRSNGWTSRTRTPIPRTLSSPTPPASSRDPSSRRGLRAPCG